MTKNRQTTLQQEIHQGQFIITIAVLLTCGLGFLINNWWIETNNNFKMTSATAHVVTHNLVSPLLFNDNAEVKKALSALENHPSFLGGKVYDKNRKLIALFPSSLSDNRHVNLDYNEKTDNAFPVYDNGEAIGYLVLVPRPGFFLAELERYALIIGFILFAAYFISILISRGTRDKVQSQIENILDVTREIRLKSNYSLRIKQEQATGAAQVREIKDIEDDINLMLETIEERNLQIAKINASLETAVENRTRELKEAQLSLVQSSRMSALGEMAAGLAHEINNPLAIIVGKSQALRKELEAHPEIGEKALEQVAKIESTTERIAKIIRGLRSFSRNGAADPFEPTLLKSMIEDTLELCAARLQSRGVTLTISEFDPELRVDCRATQICQVLLNLINNASDAIEKLESKWVKVISIGPSDKFCNIKNYRGKQLICGGSIRSHRATGNQPKKQCQHDQ